MAEHVDPESTALNDYAETALSLLGCLIKIHYEVNRVRFPLSPDRIAENDGLLHVAVWPSIRQFSGDLCAMHASGSEYHDVANRLPNADVAESGPWVGLNFGHIVFRVGLEAYRDITSCLAVRQQRDKPHEIDPYAIGVLEGVKKWAASTSLSELRKVQIRLWREVDAVQKLGDGNVDQATAGGKQVDFAHSPDFASVYWYGITYTFTKNQAACIKVLWEAWQNKTPILFGATIFAEADIQRSDDRLDLVFRSDGTVHPAWGTMIVSPEKGRYSLSQNNVTGEARDESSKPLGWNNYP